MRIIMSIIFFLSSSIGNAQIGGGYINDNEETNRSRISEYYYSISGRELLKPVYLIGAFEKPGLYHVPPGTPFLTLLSISGGPVGNADTKEILITKTGGEKKVIDLKDLMLSSQKVSVSEGDTIFIPAKEGWFNQTESNDITAIASIVTVLLTTYLVVRPSR